MTNKSPYEIRLDVLSMARDLLTSETGKIPKTDDIIQEAENLYAFIGNNSNVRSSTTALSSAPESSKPRNAKGKID